MELLVFVDDTNSVDDEVKDTFYIVSKLSEMIENSDMGKIQEVLSHQLLKDESVHYTNENITSGFWIHTALRNEMEILDFATVYIEQLASEYASPGIGFLKYDNEVDYTELIEFGKRAQVEQVSVSDAFETAETYGVVLRKCGGDGNGVIGALAGIALTLSEKTR